MGESTILRKSSGSVECRICGLNFVPDSVEDQERHEFEHRTIICGGMPLGVRELLKAYGWAIAFNDGGLERLKNQFSSEAGKRAVVFAYWKRAVSNGVPENDLEPFMAAYFAFVDAKISGDAESIEKAAQRIERWEKYA